MAMRQQQELSLPVIALTARQVEHAAALKEREKITKPSTR
jgi:hypothetical protein